jgi:putative ATP-dependent endonuclease of OLD family
MHRIGRVIIKNYRACQDVDLVLDEITPLVGQNNTGKTSILKAIKLVIVGDTKVPEADLSDPARPIEILARFEGITPALIEAMPSATQQRQIEPFILDGVLWIKVVANAGATPERQVWTPASGLDANGIPNEFRGPPTGIWAPVKALFPEPVHIEALRDLKDEIGGGSANSTMKKLLEMVMKQMIAERADLKEALDHVQTLLSTSDPTVSPESRKSFDAEASAALAQFFPDYGIATAFGQFKAEDLFKKIEVKIIEPFGEPKPFQAVGAGTQRGVDMALVQMLARRKSPLASEQRMLLLIDEPELYMHPQAIRRIRAALEALSQAGYQVIFSTHSPHMLTRETAMNTVVVQRDREAGTQAKRPAANLMHSMKANAAVDAVFTIEALSEALFTDLVIVVEGTSDVRLLSAAYAAYHGRTIEQDSVAFLPVQGSDKVRPVLNILRDMGLKAIGVGDLDGLFRHSRVHRYAMTIEDGELDQVKAHLATMATSLEFKLAEGWPTKKESKLKPEDVFALLAQEAAVKALLDDLCERAKASGVVFWRCGSVEQAFGAQDKGDDALDEALAALPTSHAQWHSERPELAACLQWIRAHVPVAIATPATAAETH